MTDTAIAKQQTQAIDRPREIAAALEAYQDTDKYHLLGPKTHLGAIPQGMTISIRELQVDAKDESHVYGVGHGKKSLSGVILDRMGALAGATVIESKRVDDRGHPHYCEFEVRVRVTDLDGSVREEVGTKTVDLRDDAGSGIQGPDRAGKSASELVQARKFGSEICATKAKLRAIAHLLGLSRSYNPGDLDKPFIVPKLVPDATDPMTQRAVLANAMGARDLLFELPVAAQVVDAQFEDASEPAAPVPDVPETDAAVDDDEPAHDPDGVVDVPAEVNRIVVKAWRHGRANGIDDPTFTKICKTQTGFETQEGMTITHAESVATAVKAFIANNKCPV